MRSLDEARAYQKQEKSVDTYELWAAILATHDALVEMGGPGLPELRCEPGAGRTSSAAGQVESGDYTDAELKIIAAADGTRIWSATMGTIFKDELSWGRTASFTSAPRSTRRRRIGHLEPWAGGRCSVRFVASRRNPEGIWTSCGASTSPTERCAGTPWTRSSIPPSRSGRHAL